VFEVVCGVDVVVMVVVVVDFWLVDVSSYKIKKFDDGGVLGVELVCNFDVFVELLVTCLCFG